MTTVAPRANTKLPIPDGMLIGGKWVGAASGKTFDVENPATGEVIAQVPMGEAADIDLAVKAARESFDAGAWRKMKSTERAAVNDPPRTAAAKYQRSSHEYTPVPSPGPVCYQGPAATGNA